MSVYYRTCFSATSNWIKKIPTFLTIFALLFSLSACEIVDDLDQFVTGMLFSEDSGEAIEDVGDENITGEFATDDKVILGVAKHIQWLPWFYADKENIIQNKGTDNGINIQLESGDYQGLIKRFVSGDIQAIAINNIDALTHFVGQEIETNVILISSYSRGHDVLLVNQQTTDLLNKTVALKTESVSHYLLHRYLLKNQIAFDDVYIEPTESEEIRNAFTQPNIDGVVTQTVTADALRQENNAQAIFSSLDIPNEIQHLVVVKRTTLEKSPKLGLALLASWFDVIDKLTGPKRADTLSELALLADMDRAVFEQYFDNIDFIKTDDKALSILRDRRMLKKMRHINYFIQRHTAITDVSTRISYPGREADTLHFDAHALESFLNSAAIADTDN